MSISDTPHPTNHIKLQWLKRNTNRNIDIRTGWRLGVPVRAPDYDYNTARLYEPADILILERDGVMTTVLHSENIQLNDDHLVKCPCCGNRIEVDGVDTDDPEAIANACHWCNGEADHIRKSAKDPLPSSGAGRGLAHSD